MTNKRILVVGTYPIKNAQHGGQKRTEAIVKAYEKTFDQVKYIAIFYKGFYKDYSTDDIPLSAASEAEVQRSPYTGDIVCGEAIFSDKVVRQRMTEHLRTLRPDIIHIEQPYPYLGLEKLLEKLRLHPKLIFGSQNIEAPMKKEILVGAGMQPDFIEATRKLLDDLEHTLSKKSDLLVACTESDAAAHRAMGAQRIVVAANGIAPIHTDQESLSYWRTRFAAEHVNKTALFVGSAHPPNWVGFLTMVSLRVGFMPFGTRILLAGSISDYFDQAITAKDNIEHVTFWQRTISCGRLSDIRLAALLTIADVIILPITEGGGSNLKTAEALIADKPIVATSHAFRSYEQFKEFPNVYIADTPEAFRKGILTAMNSLKTTRTAKQKEQVKAVLWENRFKDLIKEVKGL